jgi:hypothetical protein
VFPEDFVCPQDCQAEGFCGDGICRFPEDYNCACAQDCCVNN